MIVIARLKKQTKQSPQITPQPKNVVNISATSSFKCLSDLVIMERQIDINSIN